MIRLLTLLLLLNTSWAVAQNVELVADLTPGEESTFTYFEDQLLGRIGDKIVFQLLEGFDTADRCVSLWYFDITTGDTLRLLDAPRCNVGYAFFDFVNVADDAYIVHREDDYEGVETLFHIDGEQMVATKLSGTGFMGTIATVADGVYFGAGNELYYHHTEADSAELLLEMSDRIYSVGTFQDKIVFNGTYAFETVGLHLYDPVMRSLERIYTFPGKNPFTHHHNHFTTSTSGDKFFFFYEEDRDDEKYGLYVSDGTEGGTQRLAYYDYEKINLQTQNKIIMWQDKLYFGARPVGAEFYEFGLFVSDGTVAGTKLLTSERYDYLDPTWFVTYNGQLYFRGKRERYATEFFQTDGTEEGTVPTFDIRVITNGSTYSMHLGKIVVFNDSLMFSAYRSGIGKELHISDGTNEGTRFVDIRTGGSNSHGTPANLLAVGDELYFTARSEEFGREIYKYAAKKAVPPIANFTVNVDVNDLSVIFSDSSSDDVVSREWSFGDGSASNVPTPEHSYSAADNYEVCLIVENEAMLRDTLCQEITVGTAPVADFDYNQSNFEVNFDNTSSAFPETYEWTFGDGQSSSEVSPSYTYAMNGTYEVCLTADNALGSNTTCEEVTIMATSTDELLVDEVIQLSPNPTYSTAIITKTEQWNDPLVVAYDVAGQQVYFDWLVSANQIELKRTNQPAGIYTIVIEDGVARYFKKLIIK